MSKLSQKNLNSSKKFPSTACAASTDSNSDVLNSPLKLHPSVALRPEPFGALAYHYDNRRLIFLKHPTIVDVVKDLDQHPDLKSALCAHGIEEQQWDAYDKAICSLIESDVVVPQ